MKEHLLRKWITTCWIGIFLLLTSVMAKGQSGSTYPVSNYYTGGTLNDIAEVTITQTTEVPLLTYLTIKMRQGFKIEQLYLNNTFLGSIESGSKNGDYITYTNTINTSEYNSYTNNGVNISFKAQYTFSDIEDLDDLKSIFNYYTPNSTIQSPNDANTLEVSQAITGPGSGSSVNPMKLNLTSNSKPIIIHQMNANSRISNFDINLNGGDLTFKQEEFTGNNLPSIEMNSGSLTLDGENATLGSLTMKDGNLSLKNGAKITNFTANKGNVTIANNPRGYSFQKLSIEGDVTITGDCVISESTYQGYDYLAEETTIKKGTVTIKQLKLAPNYPFIVEDGDVTFDQMLCALKYGTPATTPTSIIQQKGGKILFKDCYLDNNNERYVDYFIEMIAGSLIIDGGVYMHGERGLLHITGDMAHAEIKNGGFYEKDYSGKSNYCAVYQEKGTVDITGGQFSNPVCIEGGTLNISKVDFLKNGAVWNNINANLHILGNQAKVSLSGGYYGGNAVYIAPGLSITPESLLADGCGFYTMNQELQPDVEIIDPKTTNSYDGVSYLDFGQVKRKETPVSNDCLEAAKTADVGPTGKDVKTIKTDGGSAPFPQYDLEINTAQGLAWLATKVHHDEYGITNGKEYDRSNVVRLTADLDMSAYNWIPFQISCRKFDGQGHCVSGLKVNQSEAAFMSVNPDTLANLVVKGQFNSISTSYTSSQQCAAGLAIYNHGTIINCGVQQSTVSCTTTDIVDAEVGGLVAYNWGGTIHNCYMTGNVTCSSTPVAGMIKPFNYGIDHSVGGIVGKNEGSIINSYHADGVVNHIPASTSTNLKIKTDDIAVNSEHPSHQATITDCTTSPTLDVLNQKVKVYNAALEIGRMAWSNWIISDGVNKNLPVHEYKEDTDDPDGPSSIESKFTLLVQGNGDFKGTYYVSKEPTDPESAPEKRTIVADTTITVINGKPFSLTATPGKGASLEKIVQIINTNEIPLDDIKEGESFTYNVVVTDTLKAYFRTDTLYVENDTTVIGNTEDITEVKQISISDAGTKDKPAVIELGNVTVKPDEDPNKEATTTINEDSHVILQLSGNNSLGKLINEGNTTLKFADNQAVTPNLSVTEVVNKGVLVDETGLIKTVQDENGDLQLSVKEETNKEIKEGSSTTLTAGAQVGDIYNVIFLWQRWNGSSWTDIQTTTETSQQPSIRTRTVLRASSPIELTNTLPVTLNTADTYQYRCLITNSKTDVSTTLTVKAEVKVTATSGDPDPVPEPDPVFYNVILPSVAGVKTEPSAGTYPVKAGDSFTFSLILEEAYNESHPIVTVGNQEIIPAINGDYKIQTITEDISISIEGIVLNIPTSNIVTKEEAIKVWGNKNTLHILTPQRTKVFIYTFGGQLYKAQTVSGKHSFSGIPPGNYLIYIDNKVFKIAL